MSDDKQRSVYDAEQANAKLEREQGAAIWRNVLLSELTVSASAGRGALPRRGSSES